MNILIPSTWLLEHLETKATPKEIQEKISLSGPSIERIYEREGESVFDIEVTTNRVDAMSVRGIARECAVILENSQIPAKLHPANWSDRLIKSSEHTLALPKIHNNPRYCKRVLAVVLQNVQRSATPDWMAKRLRQTEMSVHDSVIDITNYITHDLGHPCHAFDYDKIMALGGEIIVKEAEKGKSFTTLDGMQYKTIGGEIVFENQAGEIIDLPAIKGTLNTSIDESTKNVLFWVESIDPKKVRFASMTHAIRTTAAQLNEKNVDPELGMDVLLRGVQLYQELCKAKIASEIYDEYPEKRALSSIEVEKKTIAQYLGINLESEKISSILAQLGCQVEQNEQTFTVTPPSYRPDLEIPADIVEEVARIYGYHNLTSVLMPTPIPITKPQNSTFKLEEKLKHFLSNIGWQEVYTYSMVSEAIANESGVSLEDHLKLQNALTDDKVYLRTSIIPSLNQVIDENPTAAQLSVFEIANIYSRRTESESTLPEERLMLTLVSSKPYREVKGELETLLAQLHITEIEIKEEDSSLQLARQSGKIIVHKNNQEVELGEINVLKNARTSISISIAQLGSVAAFHPTYLPIPSSSPIIEDLTFTVPEKTLIGEVVRDIKSCNQLIQEVRLKDQYLRNFTFTLTYQDAVKNLSTPDIEPIRKNIVQLLAQKFSMQLVGKI